MRRIVIIGGMGPQASLDLHARLLQAAVDRGAINNDDFPEIMHLSVPVPDFIDGRDSGPALRMLETTLKSVRFQRNDIAVIACNTVHLLLPQLQSICKVKFVSLIDLSVEAVRAADLSCVGLLASTATIQAGLYGNLLDRQDIIALSPTKSEMHELDKSIRGVIAGEEPKQFQNKIGPIINKLRKNGAQKIILGCTELSVIYSGQKGKDLIDPLDEVCKQLIEV